MADLTEEEVRGWLDDKRRVFERAIEDVERRVEEFLADWGTAWEFTHEQVEKARIKDARRVHAKAVRRGLTSADQLLERCYRKDERQRFPVHDVLGVRVLVLSLNDVAAVRTALEELQVGELYPFGNALDFDLEDLNESPRPGGYRALHIDGSVTVRVEDRDYTVPFEVQVKTVAQHVYGQHSHDEAYVPDEANIDPRYGLVKGLQQALAETLNGADLLLAQIEEVAGAVRDDIARREAGPEISSASVANAVRETTGYKLRESDAARISDMARAAGLAATDDFKSLIDPSGDAAAQFAEAFSRERRRRPTTRELIEGLVAGPPGERELTAETDEQKAEFEEMLEEEVPANPLDSLDPNADVVVEDE